MKIVLARELIVIVTEDNGEYVAKFFNPDTGDEILLPDVEIVPEPEPEDPEPEPEEPEEPEPEPYEFELAAYMVDPNTGIASLLTPWSDDDGIAQSRLEILEARTDGDDMVFHIKTEADKMSAQEGVLFIVPTNLSVAPQTALNGNGELVSPRKPDFRTIQVKPRWEQSTALGSAWGWVIEAEGVEMSGKAASSDDIPWSWHYGFEIIGRIPLV